MEEFKDINGKTLEPGDKLVFEHDTYLGMGIFSHAAGSTLIIKDENGYKVRQIAKYQTQLKIYKI